MKKITFLALLISICSFAQTPVLNFDTITPEFDFTFNPASIEAPALPNANPSAIGNTTTNVRQLNVLAASGDFQGYGGQFNAGEQINVSSSKFLLVYIRSTVNDFPVRFQFQDDVNRTQNPTEGDVTYTGNKNWQLLEVELAYASMDFGIGGGPLNLNEPIAMPPAASGLPTPYVPNLDGIYDRYAVFPDFNNSQAGAFTFWFDELVINQNAVLSTENFTKDKVSVYPNPASLAVSIIGNIKGNNVDIYDITGRLVGKRAITGNTNSVDVSELTSGIYFLKLEDGNSLRIVKQ